MVVTHHRQDLIALTFSYHPHADICRPSPSSDSSSNSAELRRTSLTLNQSPVHSRARRKSQLTLILLSLHGTHAVVTCLRGAFFPCPVRTLIFSRKFWLSPARASCALPSGLCAYSALPLVDFFLRKYAPPLPGQAQSRPRALQLLGSPEKASAKGTGFHDVDLPSAWVPMA